MSDNVAHARRQAGSRAGKGRWCGSPWSRWACVVWLASAAVGLMPWAAPAAEGPARGGSGLTQEEETVIGIYRAAGPGVVHISSTVLTQDFFFRIVPEGGAGSGFVVDDKGLILTNNHMVENAESVEVTLADKSKVPAKLVGRDPHNDVAVIRINAPREKLTPLR